MYYKLSLEQLRSFTTNLENAMRVPYAQSVHGEEEIDAVVKVLRTNTALSGNTTAFEAAIAALFGKKHGIMVNSGSSANLLALEVCNIEPGMEVITPLLTFGTVVAPILQKGLVPTFVDVDEATYVVNPADVERAITAKTRALLIPSLLGNIPNLEELHKIAVEHHLMFIEDSCDTLGATYKGAPTGHYSDISTTSFYGSHIINGAGGGGMVLVHNDKMAERLTILRGWGRHSSLFGETKWSEQLENRFNTELDGIEYDNKFVFSEAGYNVLPLEISSAFALVQLGRFPGFARLRKQRFAELLAFFTQYEEFFILPKQTAHTETNWLAFPVTIRDGAPFKRRPLATHLEQQGIQTRPVFTGNVLKQPGFKNKPHSLGATSYDNTERVMRGGMVFACHQGLTDEQFAYVQQSVHDFMKTI